MLIQTGYPDEIQKLNKIGIKGCNDSKFQLNNFKNRVVDKNVFSRMLTHIAMKIYGHIVNIEQPYSID